MILRSPLSILPNPLAGPRKIGKAGSEGSDYVEFDPANAAYSLAGCARDTTCVNLVYGVSFGTVTGDRTLNPCGQDVWIDAISVDTGDDGGLLTRPLVLPPFVDLATDISIKGIIQNMLDGAASGNLVLRGGWMVARGGMTAVSYGTDLRIIGGPTAAHGLAFVTFGVVPGGTFQAGDGVAFSVGRLGGNSSDTYDAPILLGLCAWLECRRKGF
jgi:hypothetical protein